MSTCFLTFIKEDYLYIVENFYTLCNEFLHCIFINKSGKVTTFNSLDIFYLFCISPFYLYDLLDNNERVVFTDELFK